MYHELVEFVFGLPSSFKIKEGFTKWILRKSIEPLLPSDIVWRKGKTGYEPPQEQWMKTGFMQQLRLLRLEKIPGLSETIDWATALSSLHINHLDKNIIEQTLGLVIKDWRDTRQVQLSLSELMQKTGIIAKLESL